MTSDGPRHPLAFHIRLQQTRLWVYLVSMVIGVGSRWLGVIEVPWAPGMVLFCLAIGSALLTERLYQRGRERALGLRLDHLAAVTDVAVISWGVYLTGGRDSPWYLWYLSNTGAAAFLGGAPAAIGVGAANVLAYVATLWARGDVTGIDVSLWTPVVRMAFLYGASFFFLRGVSRLQDSQRALRQLQGDQALKVDELIRLTQDLDQGTRALAEANVQIREADRVKSQFLANMSHELRTPLNSIIGFSEILLERLGTTLQAKHLKFLQNIHASGQHLLGIINDILDLSKVESGKMELNPEPLEVSMVVESVLAVMQGMATKRKVRFEVDVPDVPRVTADPAKFKQVLYNLLSNAVKFSPEGGVVRVAARHRPPAESPLRADAITVSVIDQGIGIAPADQAVIFEEFRQADGTTSRQYGGTGLGLALVKRFVEFQGGQVDLVSALGQGSTFSFTLPLMARIPAPVGDEPEPEPLTVLPGANRVVVVEDDLEAYQALARALSDAGYFPIRARLGEEALEMVRSLRPTAITLDLSLPDMSGWDVLKEVKRDPLTAATPVVIVSLTDNRELGLTLGAEDYFVKPVDRIRLLARLREIAPLPSATVASRILVVDDDPAIHELVGEELARLGYVVDRADSGKAGLERARTHPPDAVVLDLMMPDMTGFEVADALKGDEATASVPIVVLTSKDLTTGDRAHLKGKIAALVQKGHAIPPRLVAAIRELEARQAREAGRGR